MLRFGPSDSIDLTDDEHPPIPGCAYACALDGLGVPPHIMARIDFKAFVLLCEEASEDIDGAQTTIANGKRTQYHLDETPEGIVLLDAVLQLPNAADDGKKYEVVWNDLMSALRNAIIALLRRAPFHVPPAYEFEFSGCSLIVQDSDEATKQQAPHIDFAGGVQCVMAVEPSTKATLVYTRALDANVHNMIPRTQEEQRLYDGNPKPCPAELCLETLAYTSSTTLAAAMKPAAAKPLQPGDISCLWGPVIHAGPAIPSSTTRTVLFITAHRKGDPPYDTNEQHSAANAALTLRSSALAACRVRDYKSFELWETETGETGELLRKIAMRTEAVQSALDEDVVKLRGLDTERGGGPDRV